MKILVVDDEPILRETVTLLLRQRGHLVVDAVDGNDAIARFAERFGDFELALIDLNMPDMNGIELFEKLRKLYPRLRGILCSGYPRSHAMDLFAKAGFDGFLQKPYKIDRLLAVLEGTAANGEMKSGS